MTTKIIVTIGPSSSSPEKLTALKNLGLVDTYRLNLSHLNIKTLEENITLFRSHGVTPALDTQGAQLRVSHSYKKGLKVNIGDYITLGRGEEPKTSNEKHLISNHPEILEQLSVGDELKIDFNGAVCKVERSGKDSVTLLTIHGGNILQNRAVDIVGKNLTLSPLTKFDKEALARSTEWGIKEVFLSFANRLSDIHECKELIPSGTRLISKIESINGIKNLREISEHSDAILIDRGDLSREVGIGRLPLLVKSIIQITKECNTPVFIATNILDTMIEESLPSRAEVSDMYSLLEMGVNGIVLAAEVAIGKHPIESVQLVNFIRRMHLYKSDGFAVIPDLVSDLKEDISEPLKSWL